MRSRQRILEATIALIDRFGYSALTVTAVAAESGVSRQTVYANFGTLTELASQVGIHVASQILSRVEGELASVSDPCDYFVEFVVLAREEVRAHRVLGDLVWAQQDNPMLAGDLIAKARLVGTPIVASVLERDGRLAAHLDDLTEVLVRTGVSAVLFDSDAVHGADALRHTLQLWCRPVLTALADATEGHGPGTPAT